MAVPQRLVLTVAAACLTAMIAGIVIGHYVFKPAATVRSDGGRVVVVPAPQPEPPQAVTNVRAVVPALEAWNADHGSYTGATLARLRTRYDSGLRDARIVFATRDDYCLESRVGDTVASKHGPGGEILPQACS